MAHAVENLLEVAGKFVADKKGSWNHDEWEAFRAETGKLGVTDSDEDKRNLGNILEGVKHFYSVLPAKSMACKTACKAPAKTKAKPKAKAKAKAKAKPKSAATA